MAMHLRRCVGSEHHPMLLGEMSDAQGLGKSGATLGCTYDSAAGTYHCGGAQ